MPFQAPARHRSHLSLIVALCASVSCPTLTFAETSTPLAKAVAQTAGSKVYTFEPSASRFDLTTRTLTLSNIKIGLTTPIGQLSGTIDELTVQNLQAASNTSISFSGETLKGLQLHLDLVDEQSKAPIGTVKFALSSESLSTSQITTVPLPTTTNTPAEWIQAIQTALANQAIDQIALEGLTTSLASADGKYNGSYALDHGKIEGLHHGKIERFLEDGMALTWATDQATAQKTTVAKAMVSGLDLGVVFDILDPRTQDQGNREWHTIVESATSQDTTTLEGPVSVHVGAQQSGRLAMRRTEHNLTDLVQTLMDQAKTASHDKIEPTPEQIATWARVVLSAFAFDGGTASAVELTFTPPPGAYITEPMKAHIGQYSIGHLDATGLNSLAMDDLALSGGPFGQGSLGALRLGRVEFGDLGALLTLSQNERSTSPTSNAELHAPPLSPEQRVDLTLAALPRVTYFDLDALDLSLSGAAKDLPKGEASLDRFSLSLGHYLKGLPRDFKLNIKKLTLSKSLLNNPQLQEYGIEDVKLDQSLALSWDTEASIAKLDQLWTNFEGMGTVAADATFDTLPLSILSAGADAENQLANARLVTAHITLGNLGAVDKILNQQAAQAHLSADTLKDTYLAGLPLLLLALNDKQIQKMFTSEITAFGRDPKSLQLTLAPEKPVTVGLLSSVLEGGEVRWKDLGIDLKANKP